MAREGRLADIYMLVFKQIMKSSIYVLQCWQELTESISGMRQTLLIGRDSPPLDLHIQGVPGGM